MQQLESAAFIADNARIFGRVSVGVGSSVWFNTVIRAESHEVSIGRYTNIQDFSMLHIGYDSPVRIGDHCSITHHATVHGATVGDGCLIGIGATIMDGAVVGEGSIVAGGAVVPEGMIIPPHSIAVGTPAKVIRETDSSRANRQNAWIYHRNALAYARDEHRAWDGPEYKAWLRQLKSEIAEDRDLER